MTGSIPVSSGPVHTDKIMTPFRVFHDNTVLSNRPVWDGARREACSCRRFHTGDRRYPDKVRRDSLSYRT